MHTLLLSPYSITFGDCTQSSHLIWIALCCFSICCSWRTVMYQVLSLLVIQTS